MTSLTAIFGNNREDAGDSEKLLELYWSRAGLKKEFASLREQTFKLKEQVAEREGETARMQQKLAHLENLLLDPEWAINVLTHYQLRAFNDRCRKKVARFAEQLKQQREQRVQSKVMREWTEQRDADAQAVRREIGEHRMHMQMLEDSLQAERHRYSMMGGFMRFLRRRSMKNTLDRIVGELEQGQLRESSLQAALQDVLSRSAPETEGLDVASKRSINFMILSFVQQLYLQFSEDNLAGLTKEAGDKSAGAIRYGSRSDCDVILQTLDKRSEVLERVLDHADVMQQRAKMISAKALFDADDDAVPVPGTVSTVFSIAKNGLVRERDANLLGENYWGVAEVVSR